MRFKLPYYIKNANKELLWNVKILLGENAQILEYHKFLFSFDVMFRNMLFTHQNS